MRDGVALTAIQEPNKNLNQKTSPIKSLQQQNQILKQRLDTLAKTVQTLLERK